MASKPKTKPTVEDTILDAVKQAEEAVQEVKARHVPEQPAPEIISPPAPVASQGGRPLLVRGGAAGSQGAPAVFNPAGLVAQAIQSGADVEVIEKLGDMAWRWHERAEDARKRAAFDRAMSLAQGQFGPIKKNKRVKFKAKDSGKADTDYTHEDLASVSAGVKPALNANGLFFRFRIAQIPAQGNVTAQVSVTCVMTHKEGHFEDSTMQAAIDTSGNKNHIHAIESAVTYLSRYTLKAACGVAAEDDDDGRAAGAMDPSLPAQNRASPEQVEEIRALLIRKGRAEDRFLDWAGIQRLEELTEDQVRDAKQLFSKVPDAAP